MLQLNRIPKDTLEREIYACPDCKNPFLDTVNRSIFKNVSEGVGPGMIPPTVLGWNLLHCEPCNLILSPTNDSRSHSLNINRPEQVLYNLMLKTLKVKQALVLKLKQAVDFNEVRTVQG